MGSNPTLSLNKEGSFNGKTPVSKTGFMGSNPILLAIIIRKNGIRTHDTKILYNNLANYHFKPLSHLSEITIITKIN